MYCYARSNLGGTTRHTAQPLRGRDGFTASCSAYPTRRSRDGREDGGTPQFGQPDGACRQPSAEQGSIVVNSTVHHHDCPDCPQLHCILPAAPAALLIRAGSSRSASVTPPGGQSTPASPRTHMKFINACAPQEGAYVARLPSPSPSPQAFENDVVPVFCEPVPIRRGLSPMSVPHHTLPIPVWQEALVFISSTTNGYHAIQSPILVRYPAPPCLSYTTYASSRFHLAFSTRPCNRILQ
ncbi:hypothetical protein P280DRAFT_538057 [Massarina eburnea CBS 473.64]|uniref:Uncharacterized protein n=1 Tax=Massarina eburnea CBS 473.64 TaxID=1395130 RepID=A0A6A6SBU2_9PLEO|nr:hypothetical protein P280DRAFT_538057 [Massarina eburnea CBS 473.64]